MIPSVNITQPPSIRGTTSIIELANEAESPYKFFGPVPLIPVTAEPLNGHALVQELSKLKEDWDGYGALPPTPESCAHLKAFLGIVPSGMPAPEMSPTSNGTIELEWQSGEGEAFLEIGRTRYSGHIQPRSDATIYFEGQLTTPFSELATEQVLAVIKQLLYGASASESFTRSIQITEPVL